MAYKRRYNLNLLESVVDTLAKGDHLQEKYRDHALTGNYEGFRECHIEPDWLLIYRIDGNNLILFFSRSGTHSDLL